MNRNTRMLVYLFIAMGLLALMMDCSRRMQHRKSHANPSQEMP